MLAEVLAKARAAWPTVKVDDARFTAHLEARVKDVAGTNGPASGALIERLHTSDLYLAVACEAGDEAALAAFEARYIAMVPAFLTGIERNPTAIEEVRQLVRERLFVAPPGKRAKIAEYAGRGSLEGWVKVVTVRVASNRRRGDKPSTPIDDVAASDLPSLDPEVAMLKARYKSTFDDALREAFATMSPRERVLFRMHFIDGLGIDRLGLVFNVHRATAARWLVTAREGLLERTTAIVGARLRLSQTELGSLLAAVRSDLEVSLRALLASTTPEPEPEDAPTKGRA